MQNDFCSKGGGVYYTPDRKPIAPLAKLVPVFRNQHLPVIWLNWGVRRDVLNISPTLLHAHNTDGKGAGLAENIPGGAPISLKGGWARPSSTS